MSIMTEIGLRKLASINKYAGIGKLIGRGARALSKNKVMRSIGQSAVSGAIDGTVAGGLTGMLSTEGDFSDKMRGFSQGAMKGMGYGALAGGAIGGLAKTRPLSAKKAYSNTLDRTARHQRHVSAHNSMEFDPFFAKGFKPKVADTLGMENRARSIYANQNAIPGLAGMVAGGAGAWGAGNREQEER